MNRIKFVALSALLLYPALLLGENYALEFDGQNDYVATSRQIQDDFTLEAWIRTTASRDGDQFHLGLGLIYADVPFLGHDFGTSIANNRFCFGIGSPEDNRDISLLSQTQVTTGEWLHVAATRVRETGFIRIYVNGRLEGETQTNNHAALTDPQEILLGGNVIDSRYFRGTIDEIRIWNVARTEEEIQQTMNVTLAGNEEGLAAYYRFDDAEGQSAVDSSPSHNDGRMGANGGEDDQDPRWVQSDAPVYGATAEISSRNLNFGPVAREHPGHIILTLRNTSEQNDDFHALVFRFADQGGDPNWLTIDPAEGRIAVGEETDITFTADASNLELQDYERIIRFTCNARNLFALQMTASMTVVNGVGRLFGQVNDAASRQPVAGALVKVVADYDWERTAGEDGSYEFAAMPANSYVLQVTAPDHLPMLTDPIEVQDGQEVEQNFSLLHAEFSPHPDRVEVSLVPNDHIEPVLTISNPGNGPLTWTAEKIFPQEHLAEPWALRHTFNAGAALHDDRIEGVAFDGEHFYFAGANGANPSTIYVTDRDGNEVDHYTQLGASLYGMKDLEWDGELLWGAGYLQNVYGFRPNGDSVISFQTVYNPNSNIAYDSDEDLLWISGTTSNISAYDREGHAANRTLNRKGLKIFGLSYWPEDPDGYNLYIFDQPEAGYQFVHKMNTRSGDTLLACSIPVENGEAPSGIFISNLWDPYSWVMLSMQNIAPGNGSDRLAIWQLGQRTDWVLVSSDQGVIPAGESTDLTISFNSAGMPVDQQLDATLHFTHDGVGGVTDVPLVMNITGAGGRSQRNVGLAFGWNLVSVNVNPQGGEDFTAAVQPLVDAGLLIIAKDGSGNFYRPGNQFNNINGWSPAQSYWLKMSGDAELQVTGEPVDGDMPIELDAGWNNVSYLPRQPVDAETALSGLGENLTIARDGIGRFYLPAYHFSDMGQMSEGNGYQIRVQEAGQLVYNLGGREASLPSRYSPAEVSWLNELHPTVSMHNLLVKTEGIESGTRLEALTPEGLVAGRGVVGTDGLAGLTLWGDDPATEAVEGFKAGEEPLVVPTTVGTTETRKVAGWKPVLRDGDLAFTDGRWGVVEIGNVAVVSDFSLTAAHPNPFNGELRVDFALAQSGDASLRAYDLSGREVGLLASGKLTAGTHRAVWTANDLPSGIYLLRLESAGRSASMKVVMVR